MSAQVDARKKMMAEERQALRRAFIGDDGRPHEDGRLMVRFFARNGHLFARLDARSQDMRIDPLSMAHMEGARRLALEVLSALDIDPELLLGQTAPLAGGDHGDEQAMMET